VFEHRLANGRNAGTSETQTENIVDLSTMEQMLLNVVSAGRHKPEHIKHHHVQAFLPYAREFLGMLEEIFSAEWVVKPASNRDPFRRVFVHGWPFALKAIALAYHQARIDKLGPLAGAIGAKDAGLTVAEAFLAKTRELEADWAETPSVSLDELKERLARVDWRRYRKHWVDITSVSIKHGKPRTFRLKETGEEQVIAMAPNTAAAIGSVKDRLLSANWEALCSTVDHPISELSA